MSKSGCSSDLNNLQLHSEYKRAVSEELEVVQSIYLEELQVQHNNCGVPETVSIVLHPSTAADTDRQYVCLTVVFHLSPMYPWDVPDFVLRTPRGLGDEKLARMEEGMVHLAEERKGGPMLYELIEYVKESLTEDNIPQCVCVICLEHFCDADVFIRTECYHYFHSYCLLHYINYCEGQIAKSREDVPLHVTSELNDSEIMCPVCRTAITYTEADMRDAPPPVEGVNAVNGVTAEYVKERERLRKLYNKQKAQGGIIDLERERNKYLIRSASHSEDSTSSMDLFPLTTSDEPAASDYGTTLSHMTKRDTDDMSMVHKSPDIHDQLSSDKNDADGGLLCDDADGVIGSDDGVVDHDDGVMNHSNGVVGRDDELLQLQPRCDKSKNRVDQERIAFPHQDIHRHPNGDIHRHVNGDIHRHVNGDTHRHVNEHYPEYTRRTRGAFGRNRCRGWRGSRGRGVARGDKYQSGGRNHERVGGYRENSTKDGDCGVKKQDDGCCGSRNDDENESRNQLDNDCFSDKRNDYNESRNNFDNDGHSGKRINNNVSRNKSDNCLTRRQNSLTQLGEDGINKLYDCYGYKQNGCKNDGRKYRGSQHKNDASLDDRRMIRESDRHSQIGCNGRVDNSEDHNNERTSNRSRYGDGFERRPYDHAEHQRSRASGSLYSSGYSRGSNARHRVGPNVDGVENDRRRYHSYWQGGERDERSVSQQSDITSDSQLGQKTSYRCDSRQDVRNDSQQIGRIDDKSDSQQDGRTNDSQQGGRTSDSQQGGRTSDSQQSDRTGNKSGCQLDGRNCGKNKADFRSKHNERRVPNSRIQKDSQILSDKNVHRNDSIRYDSNMKYNGRYDNDERGHRHTNGHHTMQQKMKDMNLRSDIQTNGQNYIQGVSDKLVNKNAFTHQNGSCKDKIRYPKHCEHVQKEDERQGHFNRRVRPDDDRNFDLHESVTFYCKSIDTQRTTQLAGGVCLTPRNNSGNAVNASGHQKHDVGQQGYTGFYDAKYRRLKGGWEKCYEECKRGDLPEPEDKSKKKININENLDKFTQHGSLTGKRSGVHKSKQTLEEGKVGGQEFPPQSKNVIHSLRKEGYNTQVSDMNDYVKNIGEVNVNNNEQHSCLVHSKKYEKWFHATNNEIT